MMWLSCFVSDTSCIVCSSQDIKGMLLLEPAMIHMLGMTGITGRLLHSILMGNTCTERERERGRES